MSLDNLKESLQKLHATLESGAPVDPETKALLQTLDADIQRILANNTNATPDVSTEEASSDLVNQAQKISARLAVRHPHLEPVFREIADMLTKMGI
ncbi:DUF4404 family protein [Glaciimonas sp. CA11.2]|uniref:DUF4404 family protein n=1 Tax=unclassified Glaciimonas TaxID=2644401 RepID=UPI002AB567B4|nr:MULTISPECIES: DUF4404 family protein [unclassified Glaciimonas]MDY7546002.1 DUF4404 family protein [Glaciimonas sp. CA11.2]MEB0012154.1 DUF4404 family protein [Glaciimonas sp. Cout2]MEB0082337.1 DUF4404 family protein [Glaciimonas sp. Gout2]MEB0161295.1 DUF4404 family protein [Glaciimonas sp. CA11.2]